MELWLNTSIMNMIRSIAIVIAGLSLVACGSRTDLGWFERASSDAGTEPAPDVFGEFPCTYSPIGEPTPIRNAPPATVMPQLAHGEGRFALTYDMVDSPFYPVELIGAYCLTHPDDGFACEGIEYSEGSIDLNPAQILWNGSGWTVIESFSIDEDFSFLFLSTLSPGGEFLDTYDTDISGTRWLFDAALSSEGYLLLVENLAMGSTQVLEVDHDGTIQSPLLADFGSLPFVSTGALAADRGYEAVTWSEGRALVVQRLDRFDPEISFLSPIGETIISSVIDLREYVAGVFYAALTETGTSLYFVAADIETGVLSESVPVLSTSAYVTGLDVIAVNEGFVIAWAEQGAERSRVVARAVRFQGWTPQLWSEMVVYEGDDDDVAEQSGPPSLAYDDRAAFIAFSAWDSTSGEMQVHLQQLECHR